MTNDVPSPIDLRKMSDAATWATEAERPLGRSEMLDRIVAEVALAPTPPRVLELGSGPGFLAERILEAVPTEDYVALDFSPAMHVLARDRLAGLCDRVAFVERDFLDPRWADGLGHFDCVVTNQAVHELRHKSRATALHRQVLDVVAKDGAYLVCDHFAGDGGAANSELFMTGDEQKAALEQTGFRQVERLLTSGTMVLHAARV